MGVFALVLALAGCLPPPPDTAEPAAPAPQAKPVRVQAPEVQFTLPTRDAKSPYLRPSTADLDAARATLMKIVTTYTGDPNDPWAIGHGLLAQGPAMKLSDGRDAVPFLFEQYAEWRKVGSDDLVAFPTTQGPIRVEPHDDLMLKVFMEVGVPLTDRFVVQGKPATLEQLYKSSLYDAWIHDGVTSFESMNNTPWALQGLATVAPPGLEWVASDGKPMTMDAFTDAVVADLHEQTAFMRAAMAKGEKVEKRRQGIFAYTCGGQHLLQGAAYAVARGFGSAQSRQWVEDEVAVLFWRVDLELEIVDTLVEENPTYARVLLEQRMKFLGHFLESAHKLAALGLYEPTAAQQATLDKARDELVKTVQQLESKGLLEGLDGLRDAPDPRMNQAFLDFVGDSAHSVRGIDLSTGAGSIRY
ncbi:MAG: hypothetical protein R3F61_03185 [Myxococcota bacterium]